MGTENISGKAAKAYSSARENQHVRRLIEDEELRASLIAAAIAGRKAFQRPMAEGVALLNAIQDVYLASEVTVA